MSDLTFTGLDGQTYPLVAAGGKTVFRRSEVTEEIVNVSVPGSGPVRFTSGGTIEDRAYSINGVAVSQRTWVTCYPPAWCSGKGSGDPLAGDV